MIINKVDYIFVVRCSMEILVSGEACHIGGENLSVNQVAEIVMEVTEKKLDNKLSKVFESMVPDEVYTPGFKYGCKNAFRKLGYKKTNRMHESVN